MFELSTKHNLTSCPFEMPFAENGYKECQICNGMFNVGARKCEECSEGKSINMDSLICEESENCGIGKFKNKTSGKCE